MWDKIKAFFSRSETIFLARLEALMGLMTGAISYMDYSLIERMGTGLTKGQAMILGGIMFAKGLTAELARRRGATDL